jgi:hypothetical protein
MHKLWLQRGVIDPEKHRGQRQCRIRLEPAARNDEGARLCSSIPNFRLDIFRAEHLNTGVQLPVDPDPTLKRTLVLASDNASSL